MNHSDAAVFLINEDGYTQQMTEAVEPYLQKYRKNHTLFREQNQPIHCESFVRACPRAIILISPGFTECTVKYQELIFYFLKSEYAVFILDHCEHGKSFRLTDDPSRVHADDYHRWIGDLSCAAHFAQTLLPDLPLYLYAHSMGGGIGAALLGIEPDLFSKAILTSPMIRPATAGIPWTLTRLVTGLFCLIGKGKDYAPGNHPFDPNAAFENCACVSRKRYEWYQEKRRSDPLLQMSGATWGWLQNAIRLSGFIMKTAWKTVSCPVLLFQAENESFVVNAQQERYLEKVSPLVSARLVRIPGTKHEIYRSHNDALEVFLNEVFAFYAS